MSVGAESAASTKVSDGVFKTMAPACDKPDESLAYRIELAEGHLQFVALPAQKKIATPSLQQLAFGLLGAVVAFGVAAFALYSFVMRPRLLRDVDQQMMAARVMQQSAPERAMDFVRSTAFEQLTARVEKLERKPSVVPVPKAARPLKSALVDTPQLKKSDPADEPPMPSIKRTPLEEFIERYNRARTDPIPRQEFTTRYPSSGVALTNSLDVTRTGVAPIFQSQDSGDLLAVSVAQVEGPDPMTNDLYYLVPTLDKRWTNDRMTNSCWSYFFEIKTGNLLSTLVHPATVKNAAGQWVLTDERGELTCNPMA